MAGMKRFLLTMTLAGGLAPLGSAHALDVRQQMDLGNLYSQAVLDTLVSTCKKRVPDLGAQLTGLQSAWTTRHAAELAELVKLDAQLVAALQTTSRQDLPIKPMDLFAMRYQGAILVLHSLATVDDATARERCREMAAGLTEEASTQRSLTSARAAAQAALAELQAAPR